MYDGAYEAWDGSGIHLSESGVNGFPIKELSNGGALQLQWKGFYGDAEYTYSSGSAGERDAIWFKFPTHWITSHLSYHFKQGKERAFSATELAMVTSGQQRKCDNQRNCERDNEHSRTRFQSYF